MATVIERLRELGERGCTCGMEEDEQVPFDQLCSCDLCLWKHLPALLALAEAVKAGPCRHTADHTGETCPVCKALADLEKEAQ